jgi:hypothetical protein
LAEAAAEATTDTAAAPIAGNPDALAARLAEAAPSAGVLDELAFDGLSAAGRMDALVASERLVRHAHAGLIRRLGALAHDTTAEAWLVESELCAALAWAPTTAQHKLAEADALTRLFPATLQLLADGRISVEQARCLADLTFGLDDQVARAVEARVLPRMPGQSVSATRQAIRRAVVRADPAAAEQRHQHERTRRRVELIPEDDGMATVIPVPYTYGYEH